MQGRQTNSNIYYIKGLAQEALKSGITIDEVNEVFYRRNKAIENIKENAYLVIPQINYTMDLNIEDSSSEEFLFDNGLEKDENSSGNDSNLLIVFYVQIMPDDFVMQLHRF